MNLDFSTFRHLAEELRPVPQLLLVWLLGLMALGLMRRLLRLLRTGIVDRMGEQRDPRRIGTLMNVFRYGANVVIVGVMIMWTLAAFGISITPLLATAGVAGIAIGFGAQSLVKDFFTGLFLLLENQISEGDVIDAAGKTGCVERVTLRHVRIRDYDGSLHFIPNSMITTVTNRSRGFAYAVIDIGVRRQEDLDRVFALMHDIVRRMRADPMLGKWILDDLDMAGVEKVEEGTVLLRCRIKAYPAKQWRVRREFLRRMKAEMDDVADLKSAG